MKTIRTVSCKLDVSPDFAPVLDATLDAFARACTFVNQTLAPELTNALRMQSLVYREVRGHVNEHVKVGLPHFW